MGSLGSVDTIIGRCPHCSNEAVLISIVQECYKCTVCEEYKQTYMKRQFKYIIPNSKSKKIVDQYKEK